MTTSCSVCRILCAVFALVVSILALGIAGPVRSQEPSERSTEPRILVGPDVLVSRDGAFPHIESTVAAHPRDPSKLVGAAMTFPRPVRGVACRIYSSRDGGSTWKTVEVEEQVEKGLGDPQVAFTPRGTGLFACLTQGVRAGGRPRAALLVYRSEDGGITWEGPADVGTGSYDHPVIAVDHTGGPHAGNVYFGVLYSDRGSGEAVLGVFRSEDDGHHFVGPVEVVRSAEDGLLIAGLGVLSDGTLTVSYTRTPRGSGFGGEPGESVFEMVTSKDGGVTFSEPRKFTTRITRPRKRTEESLVSHLGTVPMWIVDGSDSTTRDRLYMMWSGWRTETGPGVWRVMFTVSSDRGLTWSEPRQLDPDVPEDAHQFLPVPAVSPAGVLGVSYFDSRGFPDLDGYHQRFTASLDGGESFLPSRRVSGEPSRPAEAAAHDRVVLLPIADREGGVFHLGVLNAEGRWPMGGDYMGLAADARGVFHPFWTDSRRGAFQVWTAPVRVERASEERGGNPEREPPPEPRPVTERVEMISGPVQWGAERGEFRFPIRLRNVSDEPLQPPLTVEVVAVGWMRDVEEFPPEEREWARGGIASILNADNSETGVGAVFDYTEALGDLEALEPGAVTGARIWHIRGRKHAQAPIRVEVRGVVSEAAR